VSTAAAAGCEETAVGHGCVVEHGQNFDGCGTLAIGSLPSDDDAPQRNRISRCNTVNCAMYSKRLA
jgi:hypothetical protein